jgi:hypothetical protein
VATAATRADVVALAAALFPAEERGALRALDGYGGESYERERVQLAVLR